VWASTARTTKEDRERGNRHSKARHSGLSNGRDATGRGHCRRCYWPAGHAHPIESASPGGGVGFSIAATTPPEDANEPSESTGSASPAFRRIRNSRANPAYTELELPLSFPSSRSWPAL